ncbi:hypothetical protein LguiA_009622 [Lonicera macranthoides]
MYTHNLEAAALAMDESVLDGDQVENLIKFCPTKEEMETLKGYTGDKENLGMEDLVFMSVDSMLNLRPGVPAMIARLDYKML